MYNVHCTSWALRLKEVNINLMPQQSAFEMASVNCRDVECIGMYIPDDQKISNGPRGVLKAKPKEDLKVGGDVQVVQPNTSRLEAVFNHSLIINPSRGIYQEIHSY